jgi:hypothetical protein
MYRHVHYLTLMFNHNNSIYIIYHHMLFQAIVFLIHLANHQNIATVDKPYLNDSGFGSQNTVNPRLLIK